MHRSDTRSQDDQRRWSQTRGGQYDDDDYRQRDLETSQGSGSMERQSDDWGQARGQAGNRWTGYVVPYRYYGPGYRGVGYYSVMYHGPSGGDAESERGEFDQRNVDYGQGQGAGAAWTGRQAQSSMTGGYAGRGPKGYQRSDQRVQEDVNDRLMANDQVDASGIEVKVKGGEVTLMGTVDDRVQKRIAEDIAESVMGVRDVMNQIKVSGFGAGSRSAESTSSGSHRSSRNGGQSTGEQTTTGSTRNQATSGSR
jgi:osmotically-inducible protein OsmY